MKKIIALAVASAFVAPAMAADVNISGYMEMSHVETKTSTTSTTAIAEDSNVVINASEELGNGITISASFNLQQNAGSESQNLALSGAFGKVAIGDVSGAIDGIDGTVDPFYAVAYTDGNAFGKDAGIRWDLPAVAEGVSASIAHTPADGTSSIAGGVSTESTGFALSYKAPNFSVRYGKEEVDKLGKTYVAATISVAGLGVAMESAAEEQTAGSSDIDTQSVGLTYSMGDVTVAYTTSEVDQAGTALSDTDTIGVHYKLGSAVFFAENSDDSIGDQDGITAVGIAYKF